MDALPILFLDFDDVLCLNTTVGGYDAVLAASGKHHDPLSVYRDLFAKPAVSSLKQLHHTLHGELAYVISSSWRSWLKRQQMFDVLQSSGLDFVAHSMADAIQWRTPDWFSPRPRATEIAGWLDQYHSPGQPFAILDDHGSGGWSLGVALREANHPFQGRVVLCDENVGLLDAHLQPLIEALGRPAFLKET